MTTINSINWVPINNNILTGGSDGSMNNVPPDATSGMPLVSNGSSSHPLFSRAMVAGGGTGTASFIPYAVICAGATDTGAWQNVATLGTAGNVLTSSGPNALPNWAPISATPSFIINVQVFTSGTALYTPTPGMVYCTIECIGGGGGGGSAKTTGSNTTAAASGGGGGYARKTISAATIGASKLVTVGSGGVGGTDGGTGGNGNVSSTESIVSATGGFGGNGLFDDGTSSGTLTSQGGIGGSGSGGDLNCTGGAGGYGLDLPILGIRNTNPGGSSVYGGGSPGSVNTSGTGSSGSNVGGGGGGSSRGDGSGFFSGGRGGSGRVIITEYILT